MAAPLAGSTSSRVLVVDDHPDSAEASCMLLSALGHTCLAATSGEDALAQIERFTPDVVICDIGLPGISGYDVARALRARHGARVYLAALTGWDQPSDRARSVAAGFDTHLVKPINAAILRAVIAASLEQRDAAPGPSGSTVLR